MAHPPSNGNFTDSCSDCSYFFPTLRVQHLVDQVLAYLTPLKYQFHRFFPYSESSYLADQVLEELPSFQKAISQICALLWEHIFGRKVFTNQPTLSNGNFTDSCFESLYSFPTLRAQHLADQFFAGRCTIKSQFTDSCSTLGVHIWQTKCWQIYPPSQMAISQIPALLWEFIFGRPSVGRSIHPSKRQFHRFLCWLLIFLSYFESSTFWQAWAWHIYTSLKWQFHRFLLWLLIFLSYPES